MPRQFAEVGIHHKTGAPPVTRTQRPRRWEPCCKLGRVAPDLRVRVRLPVKPNRLTVDKDHRDLRMRDPRRFQSILDRRMPLNGINTSLLRSPAGKIIEPPEKRMVRRWVIYCGWSLSISSSVPVTIRRRPNHTSRGSTLVFLSSTALAAIIAPSPMSQPGMIVE